jgi:hypothetical protein
MALVGVLTIGGMTGFGTTSAKAQGYGYFPGGGYGVPSYSYYGNGGHDFQPHWHTTQTPIGSFSWFGNGTHDFQPHVHNQTPYGITSYSGGPFMQTQSYSPPTPYTFMPW